MSLAEYIRAAFKAELHLHLQGAVRPATLVELARRHQVPVPADSIEWFRFLRRGSSKRSGPACTAHRTPALVSSLGAELAALKAAGVTPARGIPE